MPQVAERSVHGIVNHPIEPSIWLQVVFANIRFAVSETAAVLELAHKPIFLLIGIASMLYTSWALLSHEWRQAPEPIEIRRDQDRQLNQVIPFLCPGGGLGSCNGMITLTRRPPWLMIKRGEQGHLRSDSDLRYRKNKT